MVNIKKLSSRLTVNPWFPIVRENTPSLLGVLLQF
jgi:hypothetical protein